jgi:4-amino-4-deoxy-L-arabinose transferase-like glycosyltransferase
MLGRHPRCRALLFERRPYAAPATGLACALLGALPTARFAWSRIEDVRGWEADVVARSIVSGQGFSLTGDERWLWQKWFGDPELYFPTAWVDPVFTYLLAAVHWLFGAQAYAAMYAIFVCGVATILLVAYRMASRFGGAWTGAIAVALLAFDSALGKSYFDDISNSVVASCVVAVTALVAMRYFERPDPRRLPWLGLMVGFMVLTCPAMQYFPALLLAALAWHHRTTLRTALRSVAVVGACVVAVLTPWTIRNYVTFGEFVLVRNGAGTMAWDGVIATAETFIPGAARSPLPAPWRSQGPRDAVEKMLDKEFRLPMHRYQVDSLLAARVPGHTQMNEAQRDKLYLSHALQFARAEPLVVAQMAWSKLWIYVTRLGIPGIVTMLGALLGAALAIRDPRSWPLTLLAISYSAPFVLIIAYYGRYRAPLEPVLAVLAAVGLRMLVAHLGNLLRARTGPHAAAGRRYHPGK